MNRLKLPAAVLLASLAACLGQAAVFYRRLPEVAVSHFNAAGAPNGWMNKPLLVGIYVGTELLIAFSFLLSALAVARLPAERINLPNKAHWLSPERREETLAWLAGSFLWFGTATMVLMFDIFNQMLNVNLGAATELSHPVLSLGVYFAFSAAWTVRLWRRFRV